MRRALHIGRLVRAGLAVSFGFGIAGSQAWARESVEAHLKDRTPSILRDVQVGLQVEAGAMANSGHPKNGRNFGQLLSDYSDEPLLNQIALTIAKPVDPIGKGYGLGANVQLIYGSDARIYMIDGVSDRWINERYQLSPTIANLGLHAPWLAKRGMDAQAGIYLSPMGVEGLDPASRAFYTLAYTTEFSTTFEHLGVMSYVNLSKHYRLMFDIDAGNQVSFGRGNNNGEPDGMVGFSGANLLKSQLSFSYILRMGPEDSRRVLGRGEAKSSDRFWNDLTATYQINRKWSLSGELNQVHDEGLKADAWGGVLWSAYQIMPALTFNARGEVYRDGKNAFVGQFASNRAYGRSILGLPYSGYSVSGRGVTYGDLSFNFVYRPKIPKTLSYIKLLQIRPEIRFDRALNNARPFDDLNYKDRILIGGDLILGI